MTDQECIVFLQWALPRLRMRWPGFRKVRKQVCKRIHRRLSELKMAEARQYRTWLEHHPEEWEILDSFCRISISRFYRDRRVFDDLCRSILPELAHQATRRREIELRSWSAGCASGEEPYTLGIAWCLKMRDTFPNLSFRILATDADEFVLRRAQAADYVASSLKELPPEWVETAFLRSGRLYHLREEFRQGIEFVRQDIRIAQPSGPFHLILCRNLVFTYFDAKQQVELLAKLTDRLSLGGYLMLGCHERLPPGQVRLVEIADAPGIYRFPATV